MKRRLEAIVAAALLLALSPLLLAIALLVRWDVGTPILFRQERAGQNGEPFVLLKFRTMRSATDRYGEVRPDADRITGLGRWLRATSLDELPELWNVMKGHMSFVGPRPLLVHYLPLYDAEQRRRHDVRPGITGWAQVNGRNQLSWEEKFELDVWYVDNQSLLFDLRIILKTFSHVWRRHGITEEGHVSATPFRGSAPVDRGFPGERPA